MAVTPNIRVPGSETLDSYPAAGTIAFGQVLTFSATTVGAETVRAANDSSANILGLADKRNFVPKGHYDGFYSQYEMVPIVTKRGYALCTANAGDVNIDIGDYLEMAALGGGSGYHGLLEEAGATAGTTYTDASIAQALESVTMGGDSDQIPATDVAVGDTSITMSAGAIADMGLTVGDYILLEDITDDLQVNKVASLTSTVIGLVIPSTATLVNGDSDLVHRLYPVKVEFMHK